MYDEIEPAADDARTRVLVFNMSVRVRDLTVNRQAVAEYLNTIPTDKRDLALVRAIEVGVTEILARRLGRY